MANLFRAVILTFTISHITSTDLSTCEQKNACLCAFNEYNVIDISAAAQNQGLDGAFLEDDLNGDKYFFHGCTDGTFNYTNNDTTTPIRGSLIHINSTNAYEILGKAAEINFHAVQGESGSFELVFRRQNNVTATVRLLCDSFKQPFLKVLDSKANAFLLSSPHSCILTLHKNMSTGSVLLILLLVGSIFYFFGGGLVLYFVRGARGLELIPNIDFWRSLPGLIRDGVIFMFSGCNHHMVSTPEAYDQI